MNTLMFIFPVLTFLSPLLFWTLTPNFFSTPKEILLSLATLIVLANLAYQALIQKKIYLPSFKNALPLLLITLAVAASTVANPEGRTEVLSGKGLHLILLCVITLLSIATPLSERLHRVLRNTLLVVGGILSLHSLLSLTYLSRSPFVPLYMQNQNFTPTGNYLTSILLIISSLVLSLTLLRSTKNKLPLLSTITLNVISLVAIISLMFPGGALYPTLIPLTASWSIALDALKSLRSLLFGIGLSNYSLLFTSVKPLNLNTTEIWNILPTSASSELLTLLPTGGVLLTSSILYLLFRTLISSINTPYFGLSLLLAVSFLLLPLGLPIYILIFLTFTLTSNASHTPLPLPKPLYFITSFGAVAIALTLAYPATRYYLSEFFIRRAQIALDAGDSQKVYQNHLSAIRYSPNITNYHLSFADVNFKLAAALSQKENLTDSEREVITNLIQQSIQSGKNAITLRPNDPRTWLTVAKIYENLINVAEGADTFAIEAYTRAITLDRANPSLRLEYANLLSQIAQANPASTQSAQLQSRAASEIQIAIQLKPDYANAYYNLSLLLKNAGNLEAARKALETTLTHLAPDSTDYVRVQNELANLNTSSATTSATATPTPDTSVLTTPEPLPTPLDGGPVSLP